VTWVWLSEAGVNWCRWAFGAAPPTKAENLEAAALELTFPSSSVPTTVGQVIRRAMRLLNARNLAFESFSDERTRPKYAILSHTWGDEEVSFQDMQDRARARKKGGYDKIDKTCALAVRRGYEYAWVDTCCIDKSSSAELSEAINSMYRWYRDSAVCYVHLKDVSVDQIQRPGDTLARVEASIEKAIRTSRWFARGWTLQELIAPKKIWFYNSFWQYLGDRDKNLRDVILQKTGICAQVFGKHGRLLTLSIAERMSWAAHRETTRVEDRAYSLLGLFDVNMPMLYGEGNKAFIRLQEEIMKTSIDHSILAWGFSGFSGAARHSESKIQISDLLASSPRDFHSCGMICRRIVKVDDGPFEMTNAGLRITLPLIGPRQHLSKGDEYLAILNCRDSRTIWTALALQLVKLKETKDGSSYFGIGLAEWPTSRLVEVPIQEAHGASPTALFIMRSSSNGLSVGQRHRPPIPIALSPSPVSSLATVSILHAFYEYRPISFSIGDSSRPPEYGEWKEAAFGPMSSAALMPVTRSEALEGRGAVLLDLTSTGNSGKEYLVAPFEIRLHVDLDTEVGRRQSAPRIRLCRSVEFRQKLNTVEGQSLCRDFIRAYWDLGRARESRGHVPQNAVPHINSTCVLGLNVFAGIHTQPFLDSDGFLIKFEIAHAKGVNAHDSDESAATSIREMAEETERLHAKPRNQKTVSES
jgi:hypothetical protein